MNQSHAETTLAITETATNIIKEQKAATTPILDMKTSELALYSKRSAWLSEMERLEMSPEEFAAFLKKEGRKNAPGASSIRRWLRRKQEDDEAGTRTLAGKRRPGRPCEMCDFVLLVSFPHFLKRKTKTYQAIYDDVKAEADAKKIKMPSYASFCRWARTVDRDFAERNIMQYKDWYALYAPTIAQPDGDSNDVWVTDACQLKLWVTDGHEKPFRPWIVVFMDKASRMIMGWMISRFDITSDDVIGALKMAIMPKHKRGAYWCGKPRQIHMDNGSVFTSDQFLANLARLGIQPDYSPPGCPQSNGRMERFFKTVGESFVAGFENKIRSRMVSAEEAEKSDKAQAYWDPMVRQLDTYMMDYCQSRVHSAIGMTPHERWQERMTDMSLVNHDYSALAKLIYVERECSLTKLGVEILDGQYWTNEKLCSLNFRKEMITVHLPPEGPTENVRAFYGNTPLGEIKRPEDHVTLAPKVKRAFRTREGQVSELTTEIKSYFKRNQRYLGNLKGPKPTTASGSPKSTKPRKSASRAGALPPTVKMTEGVIAGESK